MTQAWFSKIGRHYLNNGLIKFLKLHLKYQTCYTLHLSRPLTYLDHNRPWVLWCKIQFVPAGPFSDTYSSLYIFYKTNKENVIQVRKFWTSKSIQLQKEFGSDETFNALSIRYFFCLPISKKLYNLQEMYLVSAKAKVSKVNI